jgi:hypothetical protein
MRRAARACREGFSGGRRNADPKGCGAGGGVGGPRCCRPFAKCAGEALEGPCAARVWASCKPGKNASVREEMRRKCGRRAAARHKT